MNPGILLEQLPNTVRHVLGIAKTCLTSGQLYVVGGMVRDALLHADKATLTDLDLVVENANASKLGAQLQQQLGGRLECFDTFGTCTLRLETLLVDIVTARRERYEPPGTLPDISFSTVADDLARRDFSVNALALRLQPELFELLDFHHGLDDLRNKQLRILYPNSFIDDPTRIVRGTRLAGRLDFTWESSTRYAIDQALLASTLSNVSKARFKQELELTLSETRVTPALEAMQECRALSGIFNLSLDIERTNRLDNLRQTLHVPNESYLLTLLLTKPEAELNAWLELFNYPLRYLENVRRLRTIQKADKVSSQHYAKLSEAEKMTVRSFSETLDQRLQTLTLQFQERRLTGQDVLDLGLEPGPMIGTVLATVAKARDAGEVHTFEDELALAEQLVQVKLREKQ